MSIKDNLLYRNDSRQLEDVVDVCRKLGIDEKIRKFDKGYDTMINAQTDILSYGEKQLLSFARAILKDGSIVILEELYIKSNML